MLNRATCSQPYSTWRQSVLGRIFEEAQTTSCGGRLPFLHPKTLFEKPHKRRFRTSSKHCESDKRPRKQTAKAAFEDASGKGICRNVSQHENPRTIRQVGVEVNLEDKLSEQHDDHGGSTFPPSYPAGSYRLRAVAESLKGMADQLKKAQAGNSTAAEQIEGELPKSPLEKHMEKKKWKSKREPTLEEKENLAHNPWAAMLAGPLRLDQASKIHYPAALLLDVGHIVDPGDEKRVYVLPDSLADLDEFDQRLKNGQRSAAMRRSLAGEKTRLLPYQLAFEELTDALMVWDNVSQTGRTKRGAIAKRLVPTRWQERVQKVKAYQNASAEYWKIKEEQGELDNNVFKKPSKPHEISNLQWQPAISKKIPDVMRQRVLLALNQIAQIQNQPKVKTRTYTYCIEVPEHSDVELQDIIGKQRFVANTTQDFWNDMGDIESADAIAGTGSLQGNKADPRPPIAVQPSEIQEGLPPPSTSGKLDRENPRAWLPGSFLLHIGPPSAAVAKLPKSDASTRLSEEIANTKLSHNKYIPPVLNVAGICRLPIFNLEAMLGPPFHDVLTKILARHDQFHLSDTEAQADRAKSIPGDRTNLLILVKSVTPYSHFLAQELWQLWRYLGGSDCLFEAVAESGAQESEIRVVPGERMQKARANYAGISDRAWEHLHNLLGMEYLEQERKERM